MSEWQNPSLERNEVKEIICIPVRIQVAPYRLLWGERSWYESALPDQASEQLPQKQGE